MNLIKLANDWLTGLDGETYAIGRGLGLILFAVALGLAVGVTVFAGWTSKPSLAEWGGFLAGLGTFLVTVSGGATALIFGTHSTEPKTAEKVGGDPSEEPQT